MRNPLVIGVRRDKVWNMSDWSDIAHLQQLVVRLSPKDAELINRLEQARLKLEFMFAGIRRPPDMSGVSTNSAMGDLAVKTTIDPITPG